MEDPTEWNAPQEGPKGGALAPDFKAKSVRGGAAVLVGQGVGTVLQIVTTVVLARLLSPADYGLQSMVLTLTGFFSLFKDAGLSQATIQREKLTYDQISTLFWINVALGTFLMLLTAAMGPFLAIFYREPRLLWVTIASATIFFFNSLAVQHHALLDRAMRFATGAKIGIVSSVTGTAIAIGMAALGFGYWALIVQNIAGPLVDTVGVWIAMPWIPGRPRRGSGIRSMVRFGGTVTFNTLVTYFAYNTEKILLGRFWGAGPLGLYGRAFQLANLPVQQLTSTVGSVAFPVLSRMQSDPERLRRSYLKFHSVVVSMTVPAVIACALFADEVVDTLLGPKWVGVPVVLRLLAPTALVLALINPLSWFLRATGQVGRSLRIAFLIAPVVILGIVAGLRNGPPGVALGYSSAMVLLAVPMVAWAIHGSGITAGDYWACISPPLYSGMIAGAIGFVFKLAVQNSLGQIPLLILELAVSCLVYVGFLLFAMGQKAMFIDLVSQLFPRNSSRPAES